MSDSPTVIKMSRHRLLAGMPDPHAPLKEPAWMHFDAVQTPGGGGRVSVSARNPETGEPIDLTPLLRLGPGGDYTREVRAGDLGGGGEEAVVATLRRGFGRLVDMLIGAAVMAAILALVLMLVARGGV